ncbi:Gfo/Idh/MocA family protein [Deinococcus sp.]|uniref:Gfo/Idh/MocA family protein n=1 Tax=Deinococcus sp. TaxID=47478 RepID=UPI003CC61C3C
MTGLLSEHDLQPPPDAANPPQFGIGAVGAGFIMRDVQLPAYREAGYNVVAIASRTPAHARAAAEQNGIATVHDTVEALLDDPRVEVLDVAYPPHLQLGVVREAVKRAPRLRGILLQKPMATTLEDARETVRLCREAGVTLSVNQNMRYDQSMRALKKLLDAGELGEVVVAQINMNARPHWQGYIEGYERVAMLNMSIHHLDVFRFLFGEPQRIMVSIRQDPRTPFPHSDGLAFYILEYASGLRAIGLDNCFTWADPRIEWRVEGTGGLAKGTIGWPDYPQGSPSTLDFTSQAAPGQWRRPRWKEQWFPQAFKGTMGQLLNALQTGREPELSGHENLGTMRLIEAAYRSAHEGRAVSLSELV